jgi:hypothetical protein
MATALPSSNDRFKLFCGAYRLAYAAASILVVIYGVMFGAGPVAWTIDAMMALAHGYSMKLALMLPLALGAMVGEASLGLVVALVFGRAAAAPWWKRSGARRKVDPNAIFTTWAIPLATLVVGAGLAAFVAMRNARVGDLRTVTLDDLASGRVTDPAYVQVSGSTGDLSVHMQETIDDYGYYELLPRGGAGDVAVFARVNLKTSNGVMGTDDRTGIATFRGIATHHLDAGVAHEFRRMGVPVAPHPWMIQAGDDPGDLETNYHLVVGFTIGITIFFSLGVIFERYRRHLPVFGWRTTRE